MSTTTISAICPTYARPHLLREAVESFRRQRFKGTAELIVYNNYPDQTIIIDESDFPRGFSVKVINDQEPPDSLGECYNRAIAHAGGRYLCPWEDDDIYLPWRLADAVEALESNGAEYHKRPHAWFYNYGRIVGPVSNLFFCAGTWAAGLFRRVGGCRGDFAATDQALEARLVGGTDDAITEPRDLKKIFYIYRWAGVTAHLSGIKDGREGFEQTRAILRRGQPTGKVLIRPGWARDYVAMVENWISSHPGMGEEYDV